MVGSAAFLLDDGGFVIDDDFEGGHFGGPFGVGYLHIGKKFYYKRVEEFLFYWEFYSNLTGIFQYFIAIVECNKLQLKINIIIPIMLKYLSQLYRPAFVPPLLLSPPAKNQSGLPSLEPPANLLFPPLQNSQWRYARLRPTRHSPPHRYTASPKSFNWSRTGAR